MVLKEEHDNKNQQTKKRRKKGVDKIYREISKTLFLSSFFFFFFFFLIFFIIMAASQEIEILVSDLRIRSLMGLGAPYLHHRRRRGREGGQSRSVRTVKGRETKGRNSVADPWLVNLLSRHCAVVFLADVVHL